MGLCPISKFSSRIGTRLFTYVDAKTENGCLIVSLFVAGARAREKILGLAWLRMYHFITPSGVAVSGRAYDRGYGVREGSDVPVFYCANNPKDHVAACGCWFEVD